jgi:hypothetical protein
VISKINKAMKNLVNRNLDEFLFEAKKATKTKKTKGEKKFDTTMHHWKEGEQHIGKSDKKVPKTKKGQKQALAIAFSQKEKIDEE